MEVAKAYVDTMHDLATLAFYASEASAYVARYRGQQSDDLAVFLDRLPAGARVLELGCGGGGDTAAMLAKGVDVVPTDGSPEMAQQASELLGVPVGVLLFGDLNEEQAYDGVWASACLLHVPLADLSTVLSSVRRALRAGGLFYASYKVGVGEGRDRYGRYYNYPTNAVLSAKYLAAGPWSSVELEEQQGGGYDDEPTQWLSVTARKAAG